VGLELGEYAEVEIFKKTSSSHTVGSKNRTPPASIYADLEIVRSPSHAVGLEQGFWGKLIAMAFMSPSHTVGLERQTTTLNKIGHINHFVKVAPFLNEVNFPKSEIMQS